MKTIWSGCSQLGAPVGLLKLAPSPGGATELNGPLGPSAFLALSFNFLCEWLILYYSLRNVELFVVPRVGAIL